MPTKYEVFFIPFLLLSFMIVTTPATADDPSVQIQVKGVSCPFCVYGIEKKLKKVPSVESIETNYKKSTVSLARKKGSRMDVRALDKAVMDAGFSVDFISLRIQGNLTEWEGKPALKEQDSGQIFLLIEPGKEKPHAFLSAQKLKALQQGSEGGQKPVWIQGKTHHHEEMPLAITVEASGRK